jgi:hypothetical protein
MGKKGKIGRNQPCPCGSGKKYKKCHGAIVNSLADEPAAPMAHAPEPMTFEELQQKINRLKGLLANYDLLSLLSSCFIKLSQIDWEQPEKAGMTSPYKQCTYIASLAIATPQADQTHKLDNDHWNELCALSETIFAYYGLMYFRPETILTAQESEEKHMKAGAAMAAFLHSLGSGVFASVEQMREDLHVLYAPFDAHIRSRTGLDIQDFTDLSDYIIGVLDRRLKEGPETLMKSWLTFRQRCDEGVDPEAALAEAKRNLEPHAFSQFALVGQVTLPELRSAFPAEKIDSYLSFLSQERASAPADFSFPTEQHLIEQRPLVLVRPDTYHLLTGNILFLSILRGLESLLAGDPALDERPNRHKGKVLESSTLTLFRSIFGEEAAYFEQIYETGDAHGEHDILILYKDMLFIVECKAKRIRKNFRDVDRAIERITSDFKGYIQAACDQANKLKRLILNQDETPLFDSRGDEVLRIRKSQLRQIECICVTKESEGMLATNLALLLNKEADEEYPYCISSYDLHQLSEYRVKIGITASLFVEYVGQRKHIQGKAFSDDELDFWGYFLTHKGFASVIEDRREIVPISLGYSSMFDKAYRERHEQKDGGLPS